MALPGPKPMPTNVHHLYPPSHRPAETPAGGVEARAPQEPDWRAIFPTPTARATLERKRSVKVRPASTTEELDAQNARARKVAAHTWALVVDDLTPRGYLARCDAVALEMFCVAVARLDAFERTLSVDGAQLLGRDGGLVKHPLTTQIKQQRETIKSLLAEFGLTPSARQRLRVDPFLTDDGDGLFD